MNRRSPAAASSVNRSAVTNGSRLLSGVSGNSAAYRRYKDIVEALEAEVGPDLTAGERLQVRNAAALQMHAEAMTAALVRGDVVDPEAITRANNGANRALAGLRKRRAKVKDARAGLADYLSSKAGSAQAAA